jgi:hypothetical protein
MGLLENLTIAMLSPTAPPGAAAALLDRVSLAQNVNVQGRTQLETTMPAPYHAEEKFHEALRALIGAAPQRKRLENAYLDHLSYLQDAELPISQQAKFAQLRDTLTHGKQLDPEIVIEAMSDDEVAEAARQILTLYDGIMDAARPDSVSK